MTYTVPSAVQTLLDGKARGKHWLIECDFSTGTQRFTTAPIDVASPNGNTYIGLGRYLQVELITETATPDPQSINVKLGIVNTAMLALLNGDQSVYRGKEIRFYAQFFDQNFAPVDQPIFRWTGVMNPVTISRERPDDSNGNTHGYIEMACQRRGMARARMRQGLRMTHEQQQVLYPGDMFFEFQAGLIEKPLPWLTIEFQKI